MAKARQRVARELGRRDDHLRHWMLIAADRNDRDAWADHRARLEAGLVPLTTAPVVSHASHSSRQVQLRRFLRGCDVAPFSSDEPHQVGALMARTSTSDVVDAHLAVAARVGGIVITSDPADLRVLAAHIRPSFEVKTVT